MIKSTNEGNSSSRRSPVQVLEDRARSLAEPMDEISPSGPLQGHLVFELSGELYALDSYYIKEVLPLGEYTTIPGFSPLLRGLFTLRGQLFPLLDTARILNLFPDFANHGQSILLVHSNGLTVGLLVDAYKEIRMLREDELLQEATLRKGHESEWVRAVTTDQVRVLFLERILDHIIESIGGAPQQ